MVYQINHIQKEDIKSASIILTETFKQDKGIKDLFNTENRNYLNKLNKWFCTTLNLQISSLQPTIGLYKNNKPIGLAMLSYSSGKSSFLQLLKWTFIVLRHCGLNTIQKTAQHDNFRKKFFKESNQLVLDFISIDPKHQGLGLAKRLFTAIDLEFKGRSIWLETTKKENVMIFSKFGYKMIREVKTNNIIYYIMIKK